MSPQPEPAAAQDPPQDAAFIDRVALAIGASLVQAELILHDLKLDGLTVVDVGDADVPHGSRAEQVGWRSHNNGALMEDSPHFEPLAGDVPVFRLAPPVEGDADVAK